MTKHESVSVVVNNFNYAGFVGEAIESALNQTTPPAEIVVVDDGSTDGSHAVIREFGDRVIPVLNRKNRGQAAAFNAGYRKTTGDIVIFLDADDALLPSAVEEVLAAFEPGVSKVHWPSWEFTERGVTRRLRPEHLLPDGDLAELLIRGGPWSVISPPTSGNAWSRIFLDQVFPMPEKDFRICADFYLVSLAPIYGAVRRILEPQTLWRRHEYNRYNSGDETLATRVSYELAWYDVVAEAMEHHLAEQGIPTSRAVWHERSGLLRRYRRIADATAKIEEIVPPGETFAVIDDGEWREPVIGRRPVVSDREAIWPFDDGEDYPRAPRDVHVILEEVERLRSQGVTHLFFVWPALWWLDHYTVLSTYLDRAAERLEQSWDFAAYALSGPAPDGVPLEDQSAETLELERRLIALESSQATVARELERLEGVAALTELVRASTPEGAVVAVVSRGDDELLEFEGRIGQHFPQDGRGSYAGFHPGTSADAVAAVERARKRGVQFLAFPRASFWWLEHYDGLVEHLDGRYSVTVDDPEGRVYSLKTKRRTRPAPRARPSRRTKARA